MKQNLCNIETTTSARVEKKKETFITSQFMEIQVSASDIFKNSKLNSKLPKYLK
jgi:hypothetical protein